MRLRCARRGDNCCCGVLLSRRLASRLHSVVNVLSLREKKNSLDISHIIEMNECLKRKVKIKCNFAHTIKRNTEPETWIHMVFFHAALKHTAEQNVFSYAFFLIPFRLIVHLVLLSFFCVFCFLYQMCRCCKFTWRSERKMPLENEIEWNGIGTCRRGSWLLKLIWLLLLPKKRYKKYAACQIWFFFASFY